MKPADLAAFLPGDRVIVHAVGKFGQRRHEGRLRAWNEHRLVLRTTRDGTLKIPMAQVERVVPELGE